MPKKTAGALLLLLTVAAAGAALATLIPADAIHKNDLGYLSLCPFAPWSTLALGFVAVLIWLIRGYVLTRLD
jgi:hypothetical protein